MEKVWLQSYPEGVPAEIGKLENTSLVELLHTSTSRYGEHTAFSNMGSRLTFTELTQKANAFAAFLQHLGIKKGDRVAIMLPNVLQFPVALFGILTAGGVAVNVNPLYTADEVVHQVNDAGAETIVVLANFAHVVQRALPKTQLKQVIVTELGDLFPFPKSMLVNALIRYAKKMVPSWEIPQAVMLIDALKQGADLAFEPPVLGLNDLAFLQYTGGTTGVSKGAMLSHGNILANLNQCLQWVMGGMQAGEEVFIGALPLYHIFSLLMCCFMTVKLGAESLLITNPRDIKGFTKTLKKNHYTVFVGVNTLFNGLLHYEPFCELDFSCLKLAMAGGMALQKVVAHKWHEVTNNWIVEGYGLTETSPVATINIVGAEGFTGSIGLPIPSTEVSIINDQGEHLNIGEVGELCIRGPQVMQGYWQHKDESSDVFLPDGWLRTGDIARVDERGFVYLVDRKKDMIVVSGFNVYPNEVEDVLASHPGILEAAVIGVPNKESGERVKAFVVKKDARLTKSAIITFCRAHLTRYKVPKYIEFRDELPKSNVGKILRRALREK